MRNHLKLSLLLLGVSSVAQANQATGQTFLSVKPQFQSATPERVTLFRNHQALYREDGWGGGVQFVVFGGQSTNGNKLAQFFGFNGLGGSKNPFIVNSAFTDTVNDTNYSRNIDPVNFGINYTVGTTPGAFASTLSFDPRQSYVGGGFDWRQYLGWWNDDCKKQWWFEISFPVVNVSNDMRLTETGFVTTGTVCGASPANMTQAFRGVTGGYTLTTPAGITPFTCAAETGANVTMNYGIIDGKQQHTGVADVELKLGYDYINEPNHHFEGYVGLVAPTGNKPAGIYMFEPIVGNNHHFGLMTGASLGFEVWRGCHDNTLRFEFETNNRYLFRNSQVRSFDLYNRPWSRYQLVYANATDAAAGRKTFAIDYLTQSVHVKPHWQTEINIGLVYNHCGFEAELGYNIWARQAEDVTLRTTFTTGLAIADINAAVTTASVYQTISNPQLGGGIAYPTLLADGGTITSADLNLASAASPAALAHIVYGSLGYHAEWCWPVFVGVGGSYEFSTFNTAINRWNVWGKFGVSL